MRVLQVVGNGGWALTKDLLEPPGPYAILSHTWGADEDEVTFEDVMNNSGTTKAGTTKLSFCASEAIKDGLQYFWIDTCCINKANHVELSEAITSMFRWYRNAAKCYVYLADVSSDDEDSHLKQLQWAPAFRRSRWFTRGWTLQELLAPGVVEFFSREQRKLGSKTTLESLIHEVTQIPVAALHGASLSHFTIDERLRWANGRNTAKVEDRAYCLLGIFDVSMSLRYGEGDKALGRLERKIRGSSTLRQDLIDWLAPSRPQTLHARASFHRHPGTGELFTRGPFMAWLGEESGQSCLMWITGKSGAGKTTLFSSVVEATQAFTHEMSAQMYAYHYCTISDPESRQLINMLGSIVVQIAAWQPSILDSLNDVFERDIARKRDKTLQIWELEQLLVHHLAAFSSAVLLFDALNESEDLTESLACIVRLLHKLPNLRILVTSTTDAPTTEMDQGFNVTEINIDLEKDIQTYVEYQLTNHVALRDLSYEHRERVRSTLVTKADRSFRWLSLTIANLRRQRTGKAVLVALAQMPEGLNDTYGTMLDRIPADDRTIAREALSWLCFALRPLTLLELSEAAVLEDNATTLTNESRLHRPQDILDICNGFVERNTQDGGVKLAHSSVRDYLMSDAIKSKDCAFFSLKTDEGHRNLMRKCLTYLLFDDFKQNATFVTSDVYDRRRQFPLLGYASLYWGHHAAHMTESEWSLAQRLFATKKLPLGGNYSLWLSCLVPKFSLRAARTTDPLYYAASYGITPLVRALLARAQPGDIERPGGRVGSTALQVACFRGRKEVAECLLNAGADFWSLDRGSNVPAWFWAQTNGWTEMTEQMAKLKPDHVKLENLSPEVTSQAKIIQQYFGVSVPRGQSM